MDESIVKEHWEGGICPMAKQAADVATRYPEAAAEDLVKDFYEAYKAGISGETYPTPSHLGDIEEAKRRRYDNMCRNFFELGKDAADEIKRNTFDATYEINDEYNIGIKNSKDPEKCTIYFLHKNNKPAGYSYYASTLADHKKDVGLYLDMGRDIKINGQDMNEVIRIAKAYVGKEDDPEEDYEDEAALVRQTQALYDAGEIDDDEYERRMDFLL